MMNIVLFAPFETLASGFIVGILFGFLLRKAYVTRFNVIVGQMLLRDFTVVKVIMTAIAVGSLGMYFLHAQDPFLPYIISKTTFFAAAVGGGIFGIGMSLMGYCPGTGIGALADGARDMWFGLLGMIAGAALYGELFPWITQNIKLPEKITTITLPEYFGISPLVIIAGIFLSVGGLMYFDQNQKK